jgi:hypothetical protein
LLATLLRGHKAGRKRLAFEDEVPIKAHDGAFSPNAVQSANELSVSPRVRVEEMVEHTIEIFFRVVLRCIFVGTPFSDNIILSNSSLHQPAANDSGWGVMFALV